MGDQFKLDGDGNCAACGKLSLQGEHIQCFTCKDNFHVVCTAAGADDKVATKTTVSGFLLPSTKRNFMFNCDRCLTELEMRMADTESRRVDILENKMDGIDTQLAEIKKLLNTKTKATEVVQGKEKVANQEKYSIWFDKERLKSVKAPEPKAVLVINATPDSQKNTENRNAIEKVVMDNGISLTETYENRSGNLVLVCESQEARDRLKNVVENGNQGIEMSSPKTKQKPITIVGLPKSYKEEEIVDLLLKNDFISNFAVANKIEDHLKIHVVKPLRNNPKVFQVFASVSPILRDGINQFRDRVLVGISSCRVYDRSQTRRCNNCQHFGHFAKECPTADEPSCGKCSGDHRTDQCSSEEKKCINCVRKNVAESNHTAFDHKCPTLMKHEQEQAQKIKYLNLRGTNQTTQP